MTYRTRKLVAILVLVLGLPGYVAVAWVVASAVGRQPLVVEIAIYVGLGVIWVLPLRRLFLGLGRPDPDAPPPARRPDETDKPGGR